MGNPTNNDLYRIAVMVRSEPEYTRSVLGNEYMGCHFDYFTINSIDDVRREVEQLHGEYDGILTAGAFSDRMVAIYGPNDIPHRYFAPALETYYRKILLEMMRDPSLKMTEIRMDLMIQEHDLPNIISQNRLGVMISEEHEMICKMSDAQVAAYEREMVARTERAARSGEYKLFLTRSPMTIERMKNSGIRLEFVRLELEDVYSQVAALRKEIELRKLRDGQIAVLYIQLAENSTPEELEQIRHTIKEYTAEKKLPEFLFAPVSEGFVAMTDVRTLNIITRQRTYCELSSRIYEQGIHATLGYGVGSTGEEAREHAITAAIYASPKAMEHGKTFLMEGSGYIIGLRISHDWREEQYLQIKEERVTVSAARVNEIARESHLSSSTLYHLYDAMERSQRSTVNSQWMTGEMELSQRMANKILANLHKSGHAEVVGQSQWGRQGRPTNEYRIIW